MKDRTCSKWAKPSAGQDEAGRAAQFAQDLAGRRLGDPRPLAGGQFGQTDPLQGNQRLANRGTADPELLTEFPFGRKEGTDRILSRPHPLGEMLDDVRRKSVMPFLPIAHAALYHKGRIVTIV
jgi:hypothetical protein